MTSKLRFILFAVVFTMVAANEKDYVCNNGTHFGCLCYKGDDGQLAKQYPDCHAFLGEQTVLIMRISLKFDTVKNGMVDRQKYERIFKRYIIANLITKYCLRQGHQKSKHCRHLDLPVKVENVVILRISCAEGHVSVVDMTMIKTSDQKLLTNVNTVSPEFLIKVVNASLRRRALKHVKLIDIGTTYFAIPRSPLFVYRNSGESQDDHVHNIPFYISLVVLILAIILICTFTALKVLRDRANAKEANDKAFAGKCHNYGSTKDEQPILLTEPTFQDEIDYSTPGRNNVFRNELKTTAIVAVQRNPSNPIPSTTFVVNYPQIQVDDHEGNENDNVNAKYKRSQSLANVRQYVKSVKMASKAGILLRKIVSDYVLSKKRIVPDKENVDEGLLPTLSKPAFYCAVEVNIDDFGGSNHRIKPNNKCGKSKSDNNLSKYTESYPKVQASKTMDILAGVKPVDRIEEEPTELFDMKNIRPDEVLSIFRVTCDVPKISITTTDQDYALLDNYDLLNQIQTTSILEEDAANKPNMEENLNASDTSSCRETDTESEDESETDNQGWDYAHTTLALSSSNYQQLCESQSSMNRLES